MNIILTLATSGLLRILKGCSYKTLLFLANSKANIIKNYQCVISMYVMNSSSVQVQRGCWRPVSRFPCSRGWWPLDQVLASSPVISPGHMGTLAGSPATRQVRLPKYTITYTPYTLNSLHSFYTLYSLHSFITCSNDNKWIMDGGSSNVHKNRQEFSKYKEI